MINDLIDSYVALCGKIYDFLVALILGETGHKPESIKVSQVRGTWAVSAFIVISVMCMLRTEDNRIDFEEREVSYRARVQKPKRKQTHNLDDERFDSIEELARAIVENDVSEHWDDFYGPMKLGGGEITKISDNGYLCSFCAAFNPEGSEYYSQIPHHMNVKDSVSIYFPNGDELREDCEYEQIDKSKVRLFNEFAHRAGNLPEMIVLCKKTAAQMECEGFVYSIDFVFPVAKTKSGKFMIDPECRKSRYADPDCFEDIYHWRFASSEYINMQTNIYPIVAVRNGKTYQVHGKWKCAYDGYMRVHDAVNRAYTIRDRISWLEVLRNDENELTTAVRGINELLTTSIQDMENLPSRLEL